MLVGDQIGDSSVSGLGVEFREVRGGRVSGTEFGGKGVVCLGQGVEVRRGGPRREQVPTHL